MFSSNFLMIMEKKISFWFATTQINQIKVLHEKVFSRNTVYFVGKFFSGATSTAFITQQNSTKTLIQSDWLSCCNYHAAIPMIIYHLELGKIAR